MANLSLRVCLLSLVALLTPVLAASLPSQSSIHAVNGGENVTLTFDDLPTHNGFGKISSYHDIDFSSFHLINTTAAASAGLISVSDAGCATSPHNALIAQRSKTPTLWPRITLSPLAHALPGEAPFFNFHGISMKPMNQSGHFVCIYVQAYGVDDEKAIRAFSGMLGCFPPQFKGGHVNLTDFWPWWGRKVNMIELYAEASIDHGDEEGEWVDWPFCLDDIVIERLDGSDDREWPEKEWPGYLPLLPPFEFGDEMRNASVKHSLFSEDGRKGFDLWKSKGAPGVFVHFDSPLATRLRVSET